MCGSDANVLINCCNIARFYRNILIKFVWQYLLSSANEFGAKSKNFKCKENVYEILCDAQLPSVGHDSSVGIATCYGLDGPGIESRWRARLSSFVPAAFCFWLFVTLRSTRTFREYWVKGIQCRKVSVRRTLSHVRNVFRPFFVTPRLRRLCRNKLKCCTMMMDGGVDVIVHILLIL